MDDAMDEDTYGFGSFSELFDAAASTSHSAKRLDVSALSRFCMSERLLTRFQQQQRRKDKRCVMFQHVAARFDGAGIDGGLGALGVTSQLDGGGVVWLQTMQSDSNALERRKKELRDITNHKEEEQKEAAALFVSVQQVATVQSTTVQNKVQGVEMKLVDGYRLELTFMPGPFLKATHRDEFVDMLKKQMKKEKEEGEQVQTPGRIGRKPAKTVTSGKKKKMRCEKEEFRQLVRRYAKMDPMSDEAIAIAKQVYAGTGYHLGPMVKTAPRFTDDSEYRKKMVEKLTGFLKRMNQEWGEADKDRELHTKAKSSRNEDDLFEYTDTSTGEKIPSREYERRYLEYVKADEINPVIHLFADHKKTETQNDRTPPAVSSEDGRSASSIFMATMGIDISSSCIVEKDYFSPRVTLNAPMFRGEDAAFRAAVDCAREKLLDTLNSMLTRAPKNCTSLTRTQSTISTTATRKRNQDRRRSLALPSSEDLQSTIETNSAKSSKDANGTVSNEGDSQQSRMKRNRPTSNKADGAQKSRRKARRQSIVRQVDLPSVMTSEVEEKMTAADKRRTPISSRKSPRSRLGGSGYSRETSSLEMVGDEDTGNLCKLCYSEQTLVHMNPCDHSVCPSCWSRLSPSSGENGTSSRRVCPWDREVVTKRSFGACDDDFVVKFGDNGPDRMEVTSKQASATVTRLLQWKKHNDAKREVKARLQEDERIEEEERHLSLAKTLPLNQVQAAAIRNYRAAGELKWRRLMLQAVGEQQQLDKEEAECRFRPHFVSRPPRSPRHLTTTSKTCRCSCAASASSTCQPRPATSAEIVKRRRSASEGGGDVFERLYRPPHADVKLKTAALQHHTKSKRISAQAEAAFIARQERDQEGRQRRRAELAALQRFTHQPRVLKHSKEICAALREAEKVVDPSPSEQNCSKLEKHARYTIPPCTSAPSCKPASVGSIPFRTLIRALQQQEQHMRYISKCT